MSGSYCRVKTHCLVQPPDRELVSSNPSHCFYHGTQEDAGGYHGFQQGQDGDVCAEGFPTRAYPTSQVETTWNSACPNELQSSIIMSETGFDDGCVGFCGNAHRSLN